MIILSRIVYFLQIKDILVCGYAHETNILKYNDGNDGNDADDDEMDEKQSSAPSDWYSQTWIDGNYDDDDDKNDDDDDDNDDMDEKQSSAPSDW